VKELGPVEHVAERISRLERARDDEAQLTGTATAVWRPPRDTPN
jgi:hypothetical protein